MTDERSGSCYQLALLTRIKWINCEIIAKLDSVLM